MGIGTAVDDEIGEWAGDIFDFLFETFFPEIYADKDSAWCQFYDTGGLACPFPPLAVDVDRWESATGWVLAGVFGGLTDFDRWSTFKIVTLVDPPKITFVGDALNGQINIKGK